MNADDEEWVGSAMINDAMVVDLLVSLNQANYTPPPLPVKQLEWSVRQRRSRPAAIKPAPRASPTTPLSWSAAISVSGGRGGFSGAEESSHSHPPPSKLTQTKRSKATNNSEKSIAKRSRKKKTLTELKEEENLLLKERRELKREISALHVTLEKQRAISESLKRIKMELQPPLERGTTTETEATISSPDQEKIASSHPILPITPSPIEVKAVAALEAKFKLPDLNIVFEDSGCEIS